MKRTFTLLFLAGSLALAVAASAQNGAVAPASPSGAAAQVAPPTKVGIIDIQQAILNSNEGRRDFEAMAKKYEPKRAALEKTNQEVEELKKTLSNTGDKLNDEARNALLKQIDQKQRNLQHDADSFQADVQTEQNELANRIGQKMMTVLDKFAKDNGYALVLDVSTPQSPVLWANMASVDLTSVIVNAYNIQSGVPAPAAAAPSAARPSAPASRPAVPAAGGATPTQKPATPPTTPKQ